MIGYALIFFAYLLGSLSSAIITCRLMGLEDPRSQGSNNPGATNVLRFGGKKAAAITLFGDMLKGLVPVLIARFYLEMDGVMLASVAMATFLGHLYPLFFSFKGGKGVATAIGVQLGLGWMIGGCVVFIWLFIAKVLKMSSLSALISMALAPIIVWFLTQSIELSIMQIMMTLMLFWRHKSNIKNILDGSEGKLSRANEES